MAQVCLRSWKRIGGRFARFRSHANERFRRLVEFIKVPTSLAKTRPSPLYRSPRRSIWASWRVRCSLNARTAASVRRTVRRLFLVFGSPNSNRPPFFVSVRRTLSVEFSRVPPKRRGAKRKSGRKEERARKPPNTPTHTNADEQAQNYPVS